MTETFRKIRRFLYGQHFADGLRTATLIIIPAVIASYWDHFDIGLDIAIGAMCVSISDTPGPARHKRNAMFASCLFIPLVALLTGFSRSDVYLMGVVLTGLAFFFAMFTMYGARAGLLGTSILLLMVLQMDKEFTPAQVVMNSLYLTAGALWYAAISLLILWAFPYRAAQRALGECVRETAAYLALRGSLYDVTIPLDEVFQRLIAQQVILNDKQNEVRDLLFKNKKIVNGETRRAKTMIVTFDELVDLYERINASHLDYTAIRERYRNTDILRDINTTIASLSGVLEYTGASIQYNISPSHFTDFAEKLDELSARINEIIKNETRPVLDNLLINIENMSRVVTDLQHYFSGAYPLLARSDRSLDHSLFVSHQKIDPRLFRYNLTFDSLTFRHSLRMALACLVGFIVAKLITHGHHSYWIQITIIFVLKPAFSLTRQRNTERILGTLIGGLIGVVILVFVHSTTLLFLLMFLFMLLTYSFQRHQYTVAVIFMTPYILILFHFMHMGLLQVAEERVIDTIIGSVIALVAGYLILPDWESDQLRGYITAILDANYRYLRAIRNNMAGGRLSATEYKLIRKDVYVNMSNLSAAVRRMISEPKRTHKNTAEVQKFSMLNYLLSSYIAAAKEYVDSITDKPTSADIGLTDEALDILSESIKELKATNRSMPAARASSIAMHTQEIMEPKDPFESIYTTSIEIDKLTRVL